MGNKNPEAVTFYGNTLEHNLKHWFNNWQFFHDRKPGLNSGGVAEAFARLVGFEVLEDMPKTWSLSEQHDMGTKVVKEPANETDNGTIEINAYVGISPDYLGCTFRFTTSLESIKNRTRVIREEIEAKRKEIKYKRRLEKDD